MERADQERCPLCSRILKVDEEGLWCEHDGRYFSEDDVARALEWRRLTTNQKVERFKALGRADAEAKYSLMPAQVAEVERLVHDAASITKTVRASVVPSKNSFFGLARGISDATALCELIDNAIDAGRLRKPDKAIRVEIRLDDALEKLLVVDNAGGMDVDDMRRCFTLGSHRPEGTELSNAIGRYGIGAKEAFYHFGREVIVRSRLSTAPTGIRAVVGEDWLRHEDWNIDIDEGLDDIDPGTTSIEIGRLEKSDLDSPLPMELFGVYERLIRAGVVEVNFQGAALTSTVEPIVLYPPGLGPRTYTLRSGNVDVAISIALISKPPAASGVFLYAQGRRFAHYPWGDRTINMLVEGVQKHQLREKIRVEVSFEGPIDEIPINSNKSGLRTNTLLDITAKLLTKIAAPYFRAIPPLSQDRATSLVNSLTSDTTGEHGRDFSADLGRVSLSTSIPAAQLGDFAAFKRFLDERDRPPQTAKESTAPTEAFGGTPDGRRDGGQSSSQAETIERGTDAELTDGLDLPSYSRNGPASVVRRVRVRVDDNCKADAIINGWLADGVAKGIRIDPL